jgi:hypothetical protein
MGRIESNSRKAKEPGIDIIYSSDSKINKKLMKLLVEANFLNGFKFCMDNF